MQVCFQQASLFYYKVPRNLSWWRLEGWHVFEVCIVLAQFLLLDLKLMGVSMVAVSNCIW